MALCCFALCEGHDPWIRSQNPASLDSAIASIRGDVVRPDSVCAESSVISPSVIIGSLGGLSLIVVAETTTKGEAIYWPYTILVIELIAMLGFSRGLTNRQRFRSFTGGFMLASLILYGWIVLWMNPGALSIPLLGHLWRLGFLLAIGAGLGAGATALTRSRAS